MNKNFDKELLRRLRANLEKDGFNVITEESPKSRRLQGSKTLQNKDGSAFVAQKVEYFETNPNDTADGNRRTTCHCDNSNCKCNHNTTTTCDCDCEIPKKDELISAVLYLLKNEEIRTAIGDIVNDVIESKINHLSKRLRNLFM